MKCHQCGGGFRFGRQRLPAFGGELDFCSNRCLGDYRAELQKQVRLRRSLRFLQRSRQAGAHIARSIPISTLQA